MKRIAGVAACALALMAGAAEAAPGYRLVEPVTLNGDWLNVTVAAEPGLTSLYLEVTVANIPGRDGTLADDYLAGPATYLGESDAFPGTYRAAPRLWSKPPGTFYLQVHQRGAFISDPLPWIGPVHAVTFAPSPPPAAPIDAQGNRCRAAVRRQAQTRRVFNARRRAFRAQRTLRRKRAMNRAKRQLRAARRAFHRAC